MVKIIKKICIKERWVIFYSVFLVVMVVKFVLRGVFRGRYIFVIIVLGIEKCWIKVSWMSECYKVL